MISKELFAEYQNVFGKMYSFKYCGKMTDEEVNEEISACIHSGLDQHDYRFRYDENEAAEAIQLRDLTKLKNCYYKKFKNVYIRTFVSKDKERMIDELIACLENGVEAEGEWRDDPYRLEFYLPEE